MIIIFVVLCIARTKKFFFSIIGIYSGALKFLIKLASLIIRNQFELTWSFRDSLSVTNSLNFSSLKAGSTAMHVEEGDIALLLL